MTHSEQITEIERQLKDAGIEYSFSSYSETNMGLSIYFDINNRKCRFSDHSVTNLHRLQNEIHFKLPYYNTLSKEMKIEKKHRNVITDNKLSQL